MKQVYYSPKAPAPKGPYSPAIRWDKLVFVSGQGPIDPISSDVVDRGISGQTRQALHNVISLLEAAGSSIAQILKIQVYLRDIEDFNEMNKAYGEFFGDTGYPTRTTIQAGALPGGISIEIDAIGYIQD